MELNEHENYALSIFTTLTNNNICKERLIEYMSAIEEDLGNTDKINWLKIAIKCDNQRLVDAVLNNKDISEEKIEDAIIFGSKLKTTRTARSLEEVIISLEIPSRMNPCLTTLDYIRERRQYMCLVH